MRKRLSVKGGIFLLVVLGIVAIGVAYAVEIERGITGSVIIGQVETPDETILLYTKVPIVPLEELRFDPADISAFGRFKEQPRITFLAQNGGDAPFHLRAELVDVRLNGAPMPDALSMVMGADGGTLLPSPNHETLVQPGELVTMDVGLRFHKSPGQVGLDSGDVITFIALFTGSETPIRPPPPTPTPTARPTATARPAPTATTAPPPSITPGIKPVPMKGNLVDAIALAAQYGETPKYGGTLKNAALALFSSHDIHQSSGINVMAMGPLYNGLLITNPYSSTEVMPDLAYGWEISADGQTFTFHLHEGVTWHDGTPFTAQDVVWNVLRIYHRGRIGPNVDGNIGNFKYTMWNALMEPPDAQGNDVGITAPDRNTVVFKAQFPSPLVLLLFGAVTASILPRHIGEADPLNGIWQMRQPIGTGPFSLTEEPTTQLWKYERNPNYFKNQVPFVDLLETHIILDQQTRATAVLTERIHWNNPSTYSAIDFPLAKAMAEQDPGIVWESVPNYLFEVFAPENTREPFDDIRVRQAFSHALERGLFLHEYEGVEGLGSLQGAIGTSQFPGGPWAPPRELRDTYIGYWPDTEKRLAEARRLLADYEAEKGPIDWDSKPFQCFFDSQSCGNAVIIQALMKKVGVELRIEEGSAANLWGKMVAGDHWMSQYIGAADFEDPTDTFSKSFVTGADFGFHHGWDAEIDDLFNQQKFLTDVEARKAIVQRMDEIAMNNSRLLMLYWQVSEKLRRDYVKGVSTSPSYWGVSANLRMEHVWLDLPGARDTMQPRAGDAVAEWSPTDWLPPPEEEGAGTEHLPPWMRR